MSEQATVNAGDLKSRLVALLRQGNADEQAFGATLSEAERERTGTVDDWAPKEYIGHITYWREWETQRVQTLTKGDEPRDGSDFQTLNSESFPNLANSTWASAIERSRQSTEALAAAVEAAPESILEGPTRPQQGDGPASAALLELIINNGYLHPQQHLAEMAARNGDNETGATLQRRALATIIALDAGAGVTSNARYNVACSFARSGDRAETLDLLRQAFTDNPRLIAWARQDTDLDPLRDDPEFQALIAEL